MAAHGRPNRDGAERTATADGGPVEPDRGDDAAGGRTDLNRRRLVKGALGSVTLAAVGATGEVSVHWLTSGGAGSGVPTPYAGIENIDGPAPRALPQIPVRIDDEGYLLGLYPDSPAEPAGDDGEGEVLRGQMVGPFDYNVDWFHYCGVQDFPALDPENETNDYLRYVADAGYAWQQEGVEPETRVHVDDFGDYASWESGIGRAGIGKPADVTWRSEGVAEAVPVLLIRSRVVEALAEDAAGEIGEWLRAATREGFLAVLNKCTHFCCVSGFKRTAQALKFDAEDLVYCPCHQSVFDPFNVVRDELLARR